MNDHTGTLRTMIHQRKDGPCICAECRALKYAINELSGREAVAIGWVFQHGETGRMTFCPNDGVNTPDVFAELNSGYTLCSAAFTAPQPGDGWRPIAEAPEGEVVILCDANGNRWTDVAPGVPANGCGLPAVCFQPLPAAPSTKGVGNV